MNEQATKVCAKCKASKLLSEFGKCSKNRSGLHYWCKVCVSAYRKSRRNSELELTDGDIERFRSHVEFDAHKEYLVWRGIKDKDGYGMFNIKERMLRAHRLAWMIENGPIPPGLCVLHRNDDPECVDVKYLFLGAIADNNLDKKLKQRGVIGRRNGMVVLTEDQVKQVIKLRNRGMTYENIASRVGISRSEAHHICNGYTWSHLTGIPCCR